MSQPAGLVDPLRRCIFEFNPTFAAIDTREIPVEFHYLMLVAAIFEGGLNHNL
jgi:hypothetical protein